ncbi:pilus assembly FimT family protein [Stutzerimonas azotifigens]|uniref:pilus assembly FimT family protein n=1 Tax=Stutzerimonas azotifigens TaxID=291995 RepID=UPI00040D1C78|nr:type II secretion system protein [Stutzerimonas azotifigens]
MNDQRGFTLVELVMTIVILGILAAVAGPRFFDRSSFDGRLFFEETLSAVRYAQKLAVASGCQVGFVLDGSGYALKYGGGGCGNGEVGDPSGGGGYAQALPAGVQVQRPLSLSFTSLGSVAQACSGGICTATVGGFSFTVHAATGFVEATR